MGKKLIRDRGLRITTAAKKAEQLSLALFKKSNNKRSSKDFIGEPLSKAQLLALAKEKGLKSTLINPIYNNIGKVPFGSRKDDFYAGELNKEAAQIIKYFEHFRKHKRKTLALPKTFKFWDPKHVMQRFGLRGIEFGNWVEQGDRYNMLCATAITMHDINIIIGLPHRYHGIGKLSAAFGSRGVPGAYAHFSPSEELINLRRFKEDPALSALKVGLVRPRVNVLQRKLNTSGINSYSHEWGHFIDYVIGTYIEKRGFGYASQGKRMLGRSTAKHSIKKFIKQDNFAGDFERFFHAVFWKDNLEKRPSNFQIQLQKNYPIKSREYWHYRVEIWARCFEQWLYGKMKAKGIYNPFLEPKYAEITYPSPQEAKKLEPFISKIMKRYVSEIKKFDI